MTPHEILGVEVGASEKDIKSAYRKKAKECHPDTHPNDPDAVGKFHALNNAYEALTNPNSRSGPTGQQSAPFTDFDEILRNAGFSFNFQQQRRPTNATVQAIANITLLQAHTGMEVAITVNDRIVTVRVPAGVQDGQRFKVDGEGGHENPNLPPGDVILIVRVIGDSRWGRRGDDLVTALPLDYIDIMLGRDIEMTLLTGQKINVTIPAGQTRVRVSGKGMPVQNSDRFGDLYVMIEPTIPELDEKEIARLKKVRKAQK